MTVSVRSAADVVNLALARIGYSHRIGSLYDGSKAANLALTIYGATRDELLRAEDWDFAESNVPLTLLKQAPPGGYFPPVIWTTAYPPLPWLYEYSYPADCLKVRSIRGVPLIIPNFDPIPVVWSVESDSALSAKVVVCNVPNAILTYTARLTDPNDWEADFSEALAAALARRFAPELVGLDAAKMEASDEQAARVTADNKQG